MVLYCMAYEDVVDWHCRLLLGVLDLRVVGRGATMCEQQTLVDHAGILRAE